MANDKKVTLTIDGIDANNKKSSTKIPYVNPNASDDVMRTFANKCAALSTDTHTATTKTTDEDITNAATPKPKLTLTLPYAAKLNLTSLSTDENPEYALFNQTDLPNFVYRIDQPRDFYNSRIAITVYKAAIGAESEPTYMIRIVTLLQSVPSDEGNVTVTVYFDETETTAATTAVITVPITGNANLTIL